MQSLGKETKRHGLSYTAKKVQKMAHDVIDQLDIAMEALQDITTNGSGKKKGAAALAKIYAIDNITYEEKSDAVKTAPENPR